MIRSTLLVLGIALVVSGQRAQFQTPIVRPGTPATLYADGYNLTFVISAKDIPNTHRLSNVAPYIKVYYTNRSISEPVKFATTEVIKKNQNPQYNTVVSFIWNRGQEQKIHLKVKDSGTIRDTTLGEVTFGVDDYVINKNQKINLTLSAGGSLLVEQTTPIRFQLHAKKLPHKDPFHGKSDPFVRCYWKRGQTGEEIPFYTTKHINDVEDADWNEIIEFGNYIKGTDQWFVFKVRDHDGIGSDDDLGEALFQVDPYAANRETKKVRVGTSGSGELYISPV